MEPVIYCTFSPQTITDLPSAFSSLSSEEKDEAWAQELIIGDVFAAEWDLYRAITSYKRALILLGEKNKSRQMQIEYNIILCYYLGNKNKEALAMFEEGAISQANLDFPSFDELVLIVYDAYLQTHQQEKAACVFAAIRQFHPEKEKDLALYQTLKEGDVDQARCLIENHPKRESIQRDFAWYNQFEKSPQKARMLNAVLPGAGYYYVGQRKSALTSFLINTLFTVASYQFFHRGYPAAGMITASMEIGWYLGGINGAGIEAQAFNTRLFEGVSRKILSENQCFPILMFHTSF
jgi:hypothetical protein